MEIIFLFQHLATLIVRKLFLMSDLNLPCCSRNRLVLILPTGNLQESLFPSYLFTYVEPIITSSLSFIYINQLKSLQHFLTGGIFLLWTVPSSPDDQQCPTRERSSSGGEESARVLQTPLLGGCENGVCLFGSNVTLLTRVELPINFSPFFCSTAI